MRNRIVGILMAAILLAIAFAPMTPMTVTFKDAKEENTEKALGIKNPITHIKASSNYDFGRKLGDMFGKVYRELMTTRWGNFERLKTDEMQFFAQAKRHAKMLEEYYPEFLERMQGISDTTGIDLLELLAFEIFMPTIEAGCTTCAAAPPATSDEKTYLGWNYDLLYPTKLMMTLPLFILVDIEGYNRYITFGEPCLFLGAGVLNEKGLSMVLNIVDTEELGDGLTFRELNNLAMERCSTVEEVVELLRSLPKLCSMMIFNCNSLWGDAQGGIVSIEYTHDRFVANYGENGILASANNYQWLDWREVGGCGPTGKEGFESSWLRLERMWELLREDYGSIDEGSIERFLSDHKNGPKVTVAGTEIGGHSSICCHSYDMYEGWHGGTPNVIYYLLGGEGTCASLIISPIDLVIWYCPGHPCRTPYAPIYFAKMFGIEGSSLEEPLEPLSPLTIALNGWVHGVNGMLDLVPKEVKDMLGNLVLYIYRTLGLILIGEFPPHHFIPVSGFLKK